ncbi:hypothetical protein BDR26DRAFT_1010727 [Obelidium mucronatum]|nr:hypothetical protein BDR26DRAFT_1010727 [Obelidium mucronatum]
MLVSITKQRHQMEGISLPIRREARQAAYSVQRRQLGAPTSTTLPVRNNSARYCRSPTVCSFCNAITYLYSALLYADWYSVHETAQTTPAGCKFLPSLSLSLRHCNAWKAAATREAAVPAGSPAPAAAAVQVAAASPSVLAFAEGALAAKDTKRRLFSTRRRRRRPVRRRCSSSACPGCCATSPRASRRVPRLSRAPGRRRDAVLCVQQRNNVFRKTCLAGELCWSACNGFAENDDPTTGSDSPATLPTISFLSSGKIPIRFLFASASGYLYFDAKRLTLKGDFVNYPSSDCPDFNDWKYGILGYPGPGKASDLAPRFLSRDITIIALKADNECGSSTGSGCSCEITAQSNGLEDRFILGQAYYNYLVKVHKKTAGLFYKEIPSCTHDAYCFFANVDVQAAIFSRGPVTPSIPKAA